MAIDWNSGHVAVPGTSLGQMKLGTHTHTPGHRGIALTLALPHQQFLEELHKQE